MFNGCAGLQPGLPPARSPATEAELSKVPQSWKDTYESEMSRQLRSPQAALLAAVYAGGDFAGIASTGVGKSTTWLLPAAAAARDALQGDEPTALRPVHLVVVPLAAQGAPHETKGNEFLHNMCKSAMACHSNGLVYHRSPRALFVQRGGARDSVRPATRAVSSKLACKVGHPLDLSRYDRHTLATCDCCGMADVDS